MGGKVDLMHDIAGIGDPVEYEVVVVTGGGVKVDVTDSQGTELFLEYKGRKVADV